MVCVPVAAAVGVYATEHVAVAPLPESVHEPPPLNEPGLSLMKVTLPLGVVFAPLALSVTVAVQVVEPPTVTPLGEHDTVVVVARLATATLADPLLPLCTASPPYVAVIRCVPAPAAVGV
jgi:hypothetical protein